MSIVCMCVCVCTWISWCMCEHVRVCVSLCTWLACACCRWPSSTTGLWKWWRRNWIGRQSLWTGLWARHGVSPLWFEDRPTARGQNAEGIEKSIFGPCLILHILAPYALLAEENDFGNGNMGFEPDIGPLCLPISLTSWPICPVSFFFYQLEYKRVVTALVEQERAGLFRNIEVVHDYCTNLYSPVALQIQNGQVSFFCTFNQNLRHKEWRRKKTVVGLVMLSRPVVLASSCVLYTL